MIRKLSETTTFNFQGATIKGSVIANSVVHGSVVATQPALDAEVVARLVEALDKLRHSTVNLPDAQAVPLIEAAEAAVAAAATEPDKSRLRQAFDKVVGLARVIHGSAEVVLAAQAMADLVA